ncbi:flagellar biosynthetic protein FliR [mine drainage metagenome]|uniref:Flagellar biosynthetic protein FliR n=1 Tax=mine drainage metagenome TaxID=410659 RepID=A0A1J5RCL9_9ZZZZ
MLSQLLTTDLYKLLLILSRIGTAVMFLPGLGGTLVSARSRLLTALSISFLLLPVLSPKIPALPPGPAGLLLVMAGEVTVGLYFGLLTQVLMTPLSLAGSFISYAVGMTNSFVYDNLSEQQSGIITGFLNNVALTLFLMSDLHHLVLRAVVASYELFRPGAALPVGDFSQTLVHTLGQSFVLGMQLAAPLLVFALVFNVALGLINRLVPQVNVFFVGMPLQLLAGAAILMIALPPMMALFMHFIANGLLPFVPE